MSAAVLAASATPTTWADVIDDVVGAALVLGMLLIFAWWDR